MHFSHKWQVVAKPDGRKILITLSTNIVLFSELGTDFVHHVPFFVIYVHNLIFCILHKISISDWIQHPTAAPLLTVAM